MATKEKKTQVSNTSMSDFTESPSRKQVLESLQTQYKDFMDKSEQAKNMAFKALGAIEILSSMEDNSNNGEA